MRRSLRTSLLISQAHLCALCHLKLFAAIARLLRAVMMKLPVSGLGLVPLPWLILLEPLGVRRRERRRGHLLLRLHVSGSTTEEGGASLTLRPYLPQVSLRQGIGSSRDPPRAQARRSARGHHVGPVRGR